MPRSDILGIWMSQMRRDVLAAGADCRNSAAEAIGLAHVSDFNGATQHGVGPYPLNVVDGVRINTGITASSWLALGPIGTGALGLLLLGQDSLPVFTAADMPVIGQVAQGLGIVGGAILWGYGIWWLSLAIIVTVRYLREGLPFNIGWWGFTFPLGVYSVGTLNLAKQTHVDAIADFGIVLVAMLNGDGRRGRATPIRVRAHRDPDHPFEAANVRLYQSDSKHKTRERRANMAEYSIRRRKFLTTMARAGAGLALTSLVGTKRALADQAPLVFPPKKLVRFPEKTDLLLLTDRPPQLETPLHYFRQDLTPNEAYFVRWHESALPTRVDPATFRLNIGGNVEHPLALSLEELRRDFEPVTFVALNICSGNSRSFFEPPVPGSQWIHGGMGNARWTGVRLKDLLDRAGMKAGSVEVTLQGLDRSPMPSLQDFKKALPIDHATDGELVVAYAMNGAPMPLLNGFPLRLVVPGYYATYWVKSLADIQVTTEPLHNIWQDVAYRAPDNPDYAESEEHLATKTNPIGKFSIHSIFVRPEPEEVVPAGRAYPLEGLAYDAGYGINRVEVSFDGGHSWLEASLDPEIDRYSWRRWRMNWTPVQRGPYELRVRAFNKAGEHQILAQWNHGGYGRKVIERTIGMVA